MGIGDFMDKAKDAVGGEKVQDALRSDKAEEISDSALGTAAEKADGLTGGRFGDQIDSARDAADERIGNDGAADRDRP